MNSRGLRNSVAGLAFTLSALAGCSGDTAKYSKVEECGEYGVQLIDKAPKPRDWENLSPTVTTTTKDTQERVRTIVYACEAMVDMNDNGLKKGIITVAEEVMGKSGAKDCQNNKNCHLLNEIESRSKWATDKGIPSVCTDLSDSIRTEHGEKYKGERRNLDRSISSLDSLCATVYYKNAEICEKTNTKCLF